MKKKIFKHIYVSLLRILPIKKEKIVFCNFSGRGYGDNPKYIAEEIHKRNLNIDMVWLCADKETIFPPYIRFVKMWSLRHYYELATAGAIVSNVRIDLGVEKRKKQTYLQTWHGPFGSKRIEGEALDILKKEYIVSAIHDGAITDAIISNSQLLDELYKRAFWLNSHSEILRIGLPRNDFLVNNADNIELITTIRAKFNIPANAYMVLYAPTFRDDYTTDGYKLNFEEIREAFENRFCRPCWMLIRLHPNARKQVEQMKFTSKIINVTSYPDIQELSIASDAVISDYSSTVFDFSIIKKPAFICALDLQHYVETRGLVDEFYHYPFPFSESSEELIKQIYDFDEIEYQKKIEAYFGKKPMYDTGNASQKAVDWLVNKMKEKLLK